MLSNITKSDIWSIWFTITSGQTKGGKDMLYKSVALLDMDSYFASVEESKNPSLRGKPFAVIGNGERPIVISANYVAKSFGVKTGMVITEAKKLCPKIIFVKADFSQYEFTTLKIIQLVEKYFPVYKEASIDEVYIAVDVVGNVSEGLARLRELKEEIKERLNLTCTVGVGKNPIIAKSACEVAKPDGFFVVEDFESFAKELPIKNVVGVGKESAKVLEEFGIETLGQFLDEKRLEGLSGFQKLKALILKEYTEPEFFKFVPPKSVGHSLSLDRHVDNLDELLEVYKYLTFGLYSKLLRGKMGTKSVSLYLKDRFGSFSISRSFVFHTNDFLLISKVIESLAERLFRGYPVSKVGISLNNLKVINGIQDSLFWAEEQRKFEKLSELDNVFFGGYFVLRGKKIV
ncbi:DNA polymerase IV [Fervidobacterium islandicum]|uniref:DNA polymerase IV n=1 Tax=Fervidobacterium islandicum TaxID=2423 RepID=A0AAI8CN09_FERIS|nr:DNA polymerase IV [Fervidobacterium islandicum]AMW33471.2 DNA polymerase IV [Fervidobacterium islandicum]